MKIVVDAFGSDSRPNAEIEGAILALQENQQLQVVLVGDQNKINLILEQKDFKSSRLEIVNCSDVITCHDIPTKAVREKTDSSLVVALKVLKQDEEATAFVSAGSTGAVLTACVLKIGRIKGVSRPALAPILPTVKYGNVMLVDCGANVDCKPINLVHFAIMGSTYMQQVYGIEKPRVGLLSNGVEEGKGCALTKETYNYLKEIDSINFVGNMEARDMLSGQYDVIVADGFYGNIALKSVEGSAKALFTILKDQIKQSKMSSVGALLMKKTFKKVKAVMDYNKTGGAIFLGANKLVIKAHGASEAEAIKNSILLAYNTSKFNLNDKIKANVDAVDLSEIIK